MKFDGKTAAHGAAVGARTIGGLISLILKIAGTLLLIVLTTGCLISCVFAIYVKTNLTSNLDVNLTEFTMDQTSVIYYEDRYGQLYELDTLYSTKNSIWVSYEEIPMDLQRAAVAIEDKRFYRHHGVDWYRTFGAFGNMFLTMKDEFGGSTLTQQLIKNLTEYDDITVKRKLLEIFRAMEFEKTYTKEEIMEWYLNVIYFGRGCYGIGTASNEYFGKDVTELTLAECASLIGITNNPSIYDPYLDREANRERQLTILQQMYKQGFISKVEHDRAVNQQLVFKQRTVETAANTSNVTSWFVDAVIEDVISDLMRERNVSYDTAERLLFTGGYQIISTYNPEIQAKVDAIYTNPEEMPEGYVKSETQELTSAIVIMTPTAEILAMSKFGEKTTSRGLNYATDVQKPPGSTIKPIASYGPALDLGYIMPYTIFNDSPNVKLIGTDWYPDNDTYTNSGLVTIRYAIQDSINTVAAQVLDLITPQVSYDFLTNKLNLKLHDESVGDGLSDIAYSPLALGQLTDGITVRELTAAYACYANNGVFTKPRTYKRILDSMGNVVYENAPQSNVAVSDVTAYYMTDMMQNVVNNGTGFTAKLSDMPAAGKTGASGGWKDRWFAGYTPYYVAAVWTGYEYPEYMGSFNPSTALWKKVMESVHEGLEYKEFTRPEGMRQVTVCVDTGLIATDACRADLRGNHTMTLYMANSAAPVAACNVHTIREVCSESKGLLTDDCPGTTVNIGMLDLSNASAKILTPAYYDRNTRFQINYIISELKPCALHKRDPQTGLSVDPQTGYLVYPENPNMLYDPATGRIYDKLSGKEVDAKTGMLIDPETGDLIDPWTGEVVPKESPNANAPDVIPRPAGVTPSPTPTPTATPAPTPTTEPETTEPETTEPETGQETEPEESPAATEPTEPVSAQTDPPETAPEESAEPEEPPEEVPPEEPETPIDEP